MRGVSDETSFSEHVARLRSEAGAEAPNAEAKRAFADALREIIDELDATAAPPETFAPETERLRRLAAELREHPPVRTGPGIAGFTGMETFHDRSPIVGLANPLAPPARIQHHPDEKSVRG